VKIFRWRAIGVVALLVVMLAIFYALFLDRVVESTVEEAGSEYLGTAVEVDGLDIRAGETSVEMRGFSIADPFDRMRNLVEAGRVQVTLEPRPLVERKIIVRRLEIGDVRFGTRRSHPAPVVSSEGFAPAALTRLREWADQFRKPILSFTPIDTIRSIVLDPSQLATVRAASALAARADSLKTATDSGFRQLDLQPTLDSAQAVVERLRDADPRRMGIAGVRQAVSDVKRSIDDIDAAKRRVDALGDVVRDGASSLTAGIEAVDDARKRDYAFARGLLKLPALSGPEISGALFGQVSIDRLQQALYWAELAKHYMPPGLLPREEPGPKRLRMSGTSVRFPVEKAYPSFAIERGELSFTIGGDDARSASYAARLTDLSSAPALTGEPTRFDVRPTAANRSAVALQASGVLDHRARVVHDRAAARGARLPLPGFDLPVLPVRVEPGRGSSELRIALDGDMVDARWSIRSDQVRWIADSSKLATLNTAESLIYRILSGLPSLDLTARATGALRSPSLSVSSNLDRAIGDRLREVAGEEIMKAEAMARAKVDSIVAERVAPVRDRALDVRAEARARVEEAKAKLDERKRQLEEELKKLSGLPFGIPGS
jgi:uncharacterized protein (TIGR03545 family)